MLHIKTIRMFMKKLFTLLAVIFLSAPLLNAQNPTGNIRGKVIDEVTHRTTAQATVVLYNADNKMQSVTDTNGSFEFKKINVGKWNLQVTVVGYEPRLISDFVITSGKEMVMSVELTEKVTKMSDVTVVSTKKGKQYTNNEMILVSGRSFNVDDTKKYAGSLGDPSRMASNFAGVVAADDSRNDIVVRGNSPIGLLWQLEGLSIPNPNHFGSLSSTGGPVSMLNNNLLDKSDFLTGAFPAQYGNALSGVFDLKLRNGNNQKHEYVFQMGFNGIEAGAEGPFSKTTKASYLVNYRFSSLELFKKLGMDVGTGTAVPVYQDASFKITLPDHHHGTFTIFGLGGKSNVDFLGNDVDTTKTDLYGNENMNMYARYQTGILGASYDKPLGKSCRLNIITGYTGTKENYNGDSISPVTRIAFPSTETEMKNQTLTAVIKLSQKVNSSNTLQYGFQGDYKMFDLYYADIYGGTVKNIRVNESGNTMLMQLFAQWKHRFNNRLTLLTGLHVQTLSLNNNFSTEPRASLQYKFGKNTSISLGYGLLAQSQILPTYFIKTHINGVDYTTNKSLDFTKSNQIVAGFESMLSKFTRLKAEVYYQHIFNAPIEQSITSYSALNSGTNFGIDFNDSLVNKGTGNNYGIELTMERFFNKGFYYLATASIYNSQYTGSDGIERNTAFNNKYAVNILFGKEWQIKKQSDNVFALNVKFSRAGGKYTSPVDVLASANSTLTKYDETRAYSIKQPDYFRCDIKLSYRKNHKHFTEEFSLDLQNVTNNKNVFRETYNNRTGTVNYQYQQGFFPVPTYRLTF